MFSGFSLQAIKVHVSGSLLTIFELNAGGLFDGLTAPPKSNFIRICNLGLLSIRKL